MNEGGLSITCYACGANGLDVYRHLGLDLRELFGKDNDDPNYVPHKVRDTHTEDQFFMAAIYRSEYTKGHKPTAADAKRMRLAVRRSQAIEAKYRVKKDAS